MFTKGFYGGEEDLHYKHCSTLRYDDSDIIMDNAKKHSMKKIIAMKIAEAKSEMKALRQDLIALGEVAKVVVEDEVYETIWDCQPARLAAA